MARRGSVPGPDVSRSKIVCLKPDNLLAKLVAWAKCKMFHLFTNPKTCDLIENQTIAKKEI